MMSEKDSNCEGKKVTLRDMHAFLLHNEIPIECSQCGDDNLLLLAGFGDEGMFFLRTPFSEKLCVEFVGIACKRCGFTRFFLADTVRESKANFFYVDAVESDSEGECP